MIRGHKGRRIFDAAGTGGTGANGREHRAAPDHGRHECVVYDLDADAVKQLEDEGATGSTSLDDFIGELSTPRVVWVMVPAAFSGATIDELTARMTRDDIVIDGGNSYYRDDVDRAAALAPYGIHHVDVGTSGGVLGLERGFCLMIGGEKEPVSHLDPIFRTIAPGVESAPRTAQRNGDPTATRPLPVTS